MVSFPEEGFDLSRSSSNSLLEAIAARIPPQQFDTWFRITPIRLQEPNRIVLTVTNRFYKTWIERKFGDTIRSCARELFGIDPVLEVDIVSETGTNHSHRPAVSLELPPSTAEKVSSRLPPEGHARAHTPSAGDSDVLPSIPINRNFTFSNFVIGPSNRLAHAAALGITESPGRSYNPLFLYGGVGLGKTHLLHAMVHRLREVSRLKVTCLTSDSFVHEFTLAREKGEMEKFRRSIRNSDVLIVDDIQFIGKKDRNQEEFFHTFNSLISESKQVVLSSDCPPKEIPGLKERLVSRFKMGLVTRIDPPDFETRLAIIHRKARARGKDLTEEIAQYLANHIQTNIREIEGAITRIFSLASLKKSPDDPVDPPITLEMTRAALKQITDEDSVTTSVAISEILKAVSVFYEVKIGDIISKKRNRTVSHARQVCMLLARRLTQLSLEEIGAFLGDRDHATVLYSVKKATKAASDTRIEADLRIITNRILASRTAL